MGVKVVSHYRRIHVPFTQTLVAEEQNLIDVEVIVSEQRDEIFAIANLKRSDVFSCVGSATYTD
jgi:hypothetical protein